MWSLLRSDHNRIWPGSWPKLCPLYNREVRDLHVKGLQCSLLSRSRRTLHDPFQSSPFFYSRSSWGLFRMPAVGRRSFLYVFLSILTVSVAKIKAKYYNISRTCYKEKKRENATETCPLYSGHHCMMFFHRSFISSGMHSNEFPCATGIIKSLPVVCQQGLEVSVWRYWTCMFRTRSFENVCSCFPLPLLSSAFSLAELELLQAIWTNKYFQLMLTDTWQESAALLLPRIV